MNRKNLNMVLMVILLFIWGSVVYKYFGKRTVTTSIYNDISDGSNISLDYTIVRDSFKLVLDDKDPFGVSQRRNRPIEIKHPPLVDLKKKSVPENVTWPIISYYGFVRGELKSTKLVLIKINNKLSRIRESEKIEDVTIVKAFSDSIIISFNKQRKTIKRINEKR